MLFTKNYLSLLIVIFLPFYFSLVNNYQKSVTFTSIIFLLLCIVFYKSIFSENVLTSVFKVEKFFPNTDSVFLLILFLITMFTQNKYLNIETITWDVSSYLVASQEINKGFLPFETQWESKGPLFLYLYNFISNIAGGNFVYFKLINDFILFLTSIFLFLSLRLNYKEKESAIFPTLLFILITSHVWFISELSEIYCLVFLSISYYIYKKLLPKVVTFLIIGFCISLSTLINQGTVLFAIPYLISICIFYRKNIFKFLASFLAGSSVPHFIFLGIYSSKSLTELYISQYIQLPLNYVQSSSPSFNEILVVLREFFKYDYFLYFAIISLIALFVSEQLGRNYYKVLDIDLLNFLTAIAFYFIAGHNYQHHLFYAIFFFVILLGKIKSTSKKSFIMSLIFLSTFSILGKTFEDSYHNITNTDEIYSNYPLRNLSVELSHLIQEENYEILALDYVLILYYLEKENMSYIIHPSNHNEDYIVNELLRLNKIKTNEFNHVSYLIEKEPKVFLCNSKIISGGEVIKLDFYNCAIDDYKNNYTKLDTSKYRYNKNLNFYFDPYKEINLYIRD